MHGVARREDGHWRVTTFAAAEQVIRQRNTIRQAGFNAELIEQLPPTLRAPVIFAEGQEHRDMRSTTARLFTPRATERHRALMQGFADQIVADFQRKGRADLSLMGQRMAALVVSHLLGMTESDIAGFERRFSNAIARDPETSRSLKAFTQKLIRQASLLNLYMRDIRPAIRVRRKAPKEDLISHLLSLGYRPIEILLECLMYGVAGVLTTREFISVCMWHFHEDPGLRQQFVGGDDAQQRALLYEILRVEPIVGALHRNTVEPVTVQTDDGVTTVPAGSKLDIDIYAVNADPAAAGESPNHVCPGRSLAASRQPIYSFGAGPHRCPGEWVAMQETHILLRTLLAVEGLAVERLPTMSFNPAIEGYELREFILRCG